MENTIPVQTKSLFQILEERNAQNLARAEPSVLGTSKEMAGNALYIVSGSLEAMAKGLELGNGFLTQELDSLVASRTTTKVEATIAQLEAIAKLTALGASPEEATVLATSYRR